MAIDSASKRASALSFGIIALALVVPSGTVDQSERQTSANLYSGILADVPIIDTPDDGITLTSSIDGAITLTSLINTNGVTASSGISATVTLTGVINSSGITTNSNIENTAVLNSVIIEGITLTSTINPNGITLRGFI